MRTQQNAIYSNYKKVQQFPEVLHLSDGKGMAEFEFLTALYCIPGVLHREKANLWYAFHLNEKS